jgi:16S rRNA (adenine1518-N6/adenine1519-N6)-dimethyltransferase
MTLPRQTTSYLIRRFQQAGLQPDTRHGQNFLIDLNLLEILLAAAELNSRDVILEIGTGTGSLTARMAPCVAQVITVEIDSHLQTMAAEELIDVPNVTMLHCDALRNKNRIAPIILETVTTQLSRFPGSQLKLVANLPYNIATPILSNLLLTETCPERMVVTIQKEVADRMVAVPRTKDYGSLGVWMQSVCDCEVLRHLPPTVFWPRPKVDSSIIRIFPSIERMRAIPNLRWYNLFLRGLFLHRRKILRSALISTLKSQLEKSVIDAIIASQGLEPTARAEELSVPTLQQLGNAFYAQILVRNPDAAAQSTPEPLMESHGEEEE